MDELSQLSLNPTVFGSNAQRREGDAGMNSLYPDPKRGLNEKSALQSSLKQERNPLSPL